MAQSILKSTICVTSMRMVGIGLQFVWFVLLVRWLPMSDVGIYSVINSLWILLRALGSLGADQAIIRDGAVLASQQHNSKLAGLARHATLRSIRIILPSLALPALITALYFNDALAFPLWLYPLMIGCGLAYLCFSISSSVLLAHEKQLPAHAMESLLLPSALIITSTIMYFGDVLSLTYLLAVQSIIAICIAGGYGWMTRRLLGKQTEKLDTQSIEEFNAVSWRLCGTIAFNNINVRLPVLCAPFIVGAANTALLEMAVRFASLLGIIQWCVAFVIAPKLSKLDKTSDNSVKQHLLVTGCWLVFLPALTLFIGFVLLGKWLMILAGGMDYAPAYTALLIVAAGFLANASSGPTTHYYMMLGHERHALRISMSETFVVLVLLPIFGFLWGVEGLALAMAAGLLLRNIWLNTRLEQLTGLYSGIWSLRGCSLALQKMKRYREAW